MSNAPPVWVNDILGKIILQANVPVVDRKKLNFVSGATVADNVATGSTDITILGGGGGFGSAVVAKTSNYALLSGDTNKVFTNTGAGGTVIFTLPAATVSLSYSFSVEVAHVLELLAIGTDVIRVGSTQSAAAGNAQSNTIGSTMILLCTKAGVWSAFSAPGTWAVT